MKKETLTFNAVPNGTRVFFYDAKQNKIDSSIILKQKFSVTQEGEWWIKYYIEDGFYIDDGDVFSTPEDVAASVAERLLTAFHNPLPF